MIKYECENGMRKLEACGSVVELLADVSTLINVIYKNLHEDAAELFKRKFIEHIEVSFMDNDEIDKLTEEKRAENKKQLEELAEIAEALKKIGDLICADNDDEEDDEA